MENGAEIDAPEPDGETALHLASRQGHLEVVQVSPRGNPGQRLQRAHQVLVDAGASKSSEDTFGDRPIDRVCESADPPCTAAKERRIEDLLSL